MKAFTYALAIALAGGVLVYLFLPPKRTKP